MNIFTGNWNTQNLGEFAENTSLATQHKHLPVSGTVIDNIERGLCCNNVSQSDFKSTGGQIERTQSLRIVIPRHI